MNIENDAPEELPLVLSKAATRRQVGLSDSSIYRLEKKGEFPKRIRLSANRVGYRREEVFAWLRERSTVNAAA